MRVLLKNLSLLCVGLAITLVGLDVYMQAAEIQTSMETTISPEYGPAYIAGKKVTRFNEGFYLGRVNEMGHYGPARPYARVADEKRVLLMGDSFVMGITVFEREHFATLLETGLNRGHGPEKQVLNFGRPDFNFWNMYQYYHDFASRWEHDLVLYFVEYTDLVPTTMLASDLYPACTVRGDSLVIDYSYRESERFHSYQKYSPLILNSSLFRMSLNAYKMVRRGELADVALDKLAPLATRHRAAPAGPPKSPSSELPPVTRAVLERLARDPQVVLVLKKDLPAEMLAEIRSYGIPVWSLVDVMSEMEQEGLDPYYWVVTNKRGHWNHEAHRRIAAYLERRIEELPGWSR